MKSRLKMQALETIQYLRDENIHEVQYFFDKVKDGRKFRYQETLNEYAVVANKGGMVHQLVVLEKGDYIRRDLSGTYHVVPQAEFEKYYERADE